ncbi:MAG: STAS domain-containing protein [Opitutales bacterium]|nr:STAS domain-containing protein [Opitutales bacterium]
MNITPIQKKAWLELKVEGRLDASWAEHFFSTVAAHMREGRHDIRVDATELNYLSSAGMRSLLRAHRELAAVSGQFAIIRASEFVIRTLSMSGFDSLLKLDLADQDDAPEADESEDKGAGWTSKGIRFEKFAIDPDARMEVRPAGRWIPWARLDAAECEKIPLGRDCIAIGTGASAESFEEAKDRMGDFASAAGCTAWLPGTGADSPDYILQEGRFVPELLAANGLRAVGGISSLLRFSPAEEGASLELSTLIESAFAATGATSVAFVAIAEVDGLVGVSLTRSPGLIGENDKPAEFPELREWMSFCGERVHSGKQALLVGFADASRSGLSQPLLPALPSRNGWAAHVHAAVFPFHPLPNGEIYMSDCVAQLFAGAEPSALLHLVEDARPTLGLGASSFLRGACWCAPATFHSEAR